MENSFFEGIDRKRIYKLTWCKFDDDLCSFGCGLADGHPKIIDWSLTTPENYGDGSGCRDGNCNYLGNSYKK